MWPSGWVRSLIPVTTTKPSNDWNDQSTAAIHQARRQREQALGRARSVTRSIAVASIAGAAALGLYVSRALPGHTTTPSVNAGTTGATSAGSPPGVSPTGGGNSSAGQSGTTLSPPNNPPTQTQQPVPVVSGST